MRAPLIIALFLGLLAFAAAMLWPQSQLDLAVASTGLPNILPLAAPPLGQTARLAIGGAAFLLLALLGLLLSRRRAPADAEVEGVDDWRRGSPQVSTPYRGAFEPAVIPGPEPITPPAAALDPGSPAADEFGGPAREGMSDRAPLAFARDAEPGEIDRAATPGEASPRHRPLSFAAQARAGEPALDPPVFAGLGRKSGPAVAMPGTPAAAPPVDDPSAMMPPAAPGRDTVADTSHPAATGADTAMLPPVAADPAAPDAAASRPAETPSRPAPTAAPADDVRHVDPPLADGLAPLATEPAPGDALDVTPARPAAEFPPVTDETAAPASAAPGEAGQLAPTPPLAVALASEPAAAADAITAATPAFPERDTAGPQPDAPPAAPHPAASNREPSAAEAAAPPMRSDDAMDIDSRQIHALERRVDALDTRITSQFAQIAQQLAEIAATTRSIARTPVQADAPAPRLSGGAIADPIERRRVARAARALRASLPPNPTDG